MSRFGLPDERPAGLNSPAAARLIKYMARAQVGVFKLTNGRVGNKWRVGAGFRKPVPTLLLEHRGRKSGKLFTTPLLYLRDGENWVVVASQAALRTTRSGSTTWRPFRRRGSMSRAAGAST